MTVIIKHKYTEAKMCRAFKKFYEKHVALGLVKPRKENNEMVCTQYWKTKKNVHDIVSLGIVRIAILLEESHQYFLKCTEYKGI